MQSFISKNLTDSIKMEEDMDCILFDADKDGDDDLLVTGGDISMKKVLFIINHVSISMMEREVSVCRQMLFLML